MTPDDDFNTLKQTWHYKRALEAGIDAMQRSKAVRDETIRRLRTSKEYQRALQLGMDVLDGKIPANDAEVMRAIDRLVAMSDSGSAFDLELTEADRDFMRTNRIQP